MRSGHRTLKELEDLTGQISLSSERVAKLDSDISALKKDQTTITAALIQSAKTEKKLSEDIAGFSERLTGLREQEDGIKNSLKETARCLGRGPGGAPTYGLEAAAGHPRPPR